MARKKNLGNPLLIAAGAKLATKVAANEIDVRRQRATEDRNAERAQQRQDELAANQIYAKQRGVDLVAASYLRRRRNRIIGYSVLGLGVAGTAVYFAIRAAKMAEVSDEAKTLNNELPPSILEKNDAIRTLFETITFGFYPPKKEVMRKERIDSLLEIADTVTDWEKLKKDYKLLSGNDLKADMIKHCSADVWALFEERAKKSASDVKSGVVQPSPINPTGEAVKDEIAENLDNKGFYVITKSKAWLYEYKTLFADTMAKYREVGAYQFVGWTTGAAMKYDEKWGWGEVFEDYYNIKGNMSGTQVDYWVRKSDVLMFKGKQETIAYLNNKHGAGYGEAMLNSWTLSGICTPCKKLRCIKNTSINGKLVKKGQNLGSLILEQSTAKQYAFRGIDNKTYYVPKQAAAIIV